jgi:hypothetical protein
MKRIDEIKASIADLNGDEAAVVLENMKSWAAAMLDAGGLSKAERAVYRRDIEAVNSLTATT